MEKRTATLQRVFRDADVAGELFDVHLQYQHTILLGEHRCFVGVLEEYAGVGSWRSDRTGKPPSSHHHHHSHPTPSHTPQQPGDLNYRMIGTPEEVLIAITEAAAKARTLSSTTTADNNNGKAAPIAAPSVPNGAAVVGAVGGKQADAGGEEGAEVQTEPLSPFGSSSSSSGSSSSSESEGVLPGEENGAAAATAAAGVAKAAGADKGSADSLASAAASSASSSSAGQHPPVIPGTSWLDVRYQGLAAGAAPHPPSLEWDALVSARDELRSVQAAGLVLHGFKEHGISFPPSCVASSVVDEIGLVSGEGSAWHGAAGPSSVSYRHLIPHHHTHHCIDGTRLQLISHNTHRSTHPPLGTATGAYAGSGAPAGTIPT